MVWRHEFQISYIGLNNRNILFNSIIILKYFHLFTSFELNVKGLNKLPCWCILILCAPCDKPWAWVALLLFFSCWGHSWRDKKYFNDAPEEKTTRPPNLWTRFEDKENLHSLPLQYHLSYREQTKSWAPSCSSNWCIQSCELHFWFLEIPFKHDFGCLLLQKEVAMLLHTEVFWRC